MVSKEAKYYFKNKKQITQENKRKQSERKLVS